MTGSATPYLGIGDHPRLPVAPSGHSPHANGLVLRSLDPVGEASAEVAGWWGWPAPYPGAGASVELRGRDRGRQGDLVGSGKALPGQGGAAKQPPPALLEVEPAGALGDEDLADAGVV